MASNGFPIACQRCGRNCTYETTSGEPIEGLILNRCGMCPPDDARCRDCGGAGFVPGIGGSIEPCEHAT